MGFFEMITAPMVVSAKVMTAGTPSKSTRVRQAGKYSKKQYKLMKKELKRGR